MNAEGFRTNVFISVMLAALGLCAALFWPFWPALAWAVVLAILIYPTHRRISRRLNNTLAAALSTLLTIALIVVPLILLLVAVTLEGKGMVRDALAALQAGSAQTAPGETAPVAEQGRTALVNTMNRLLADASRQLDRYGIHLSEEKIREMAQEQLGRIGGGVAGNAPQIVRRAVGSFVQMSLALVILFFLLKDGSRLLPAVRAFIPLSPEQTDTVLAKAVETLYATFYGVVLVAMLQGTLGGLAFWILGLPSPLLWGVAMTLLCIIPLAGAPIVWVPAALLLAVQGEYFRAIALALIGWLVVGTVDNITRPLIIGGRTSLHPLAVFLAILGGLFAVGSVGIFLGPVLLSVTLALLDILRLKLLPGPPGPPSGRPPSGGGPAPAPAKAALPKRGKASAATP